MDELVAVLVILAVFGCLMGGGALYERAVCLSKTEEIGYAARWKFIGGCQIEVNPGQWIPLDSYYFKEE